jgi:hypothetical protein
LTSISDVISLFKEAIFEQDNLAKNVLVDLLLELGQEDFANLIRELRLFHVLVIDNREANVNTAKSIIVKSKWEAEKYALNIIQTSTDYLDNPDERDMTKINELIHEGDIEQACNYFSIYYYPEIYIKEIFPLNESSSHK